jgi:purine-binding chemotaxis protein CheW
MTGGQYVTFYLENETYGVEIGFVQEIIRVPGMVRVPLAPAYLEGLANLRGTILTVVDARRKFGLAKKPPGETTRVIVLNDGRRQIGYIVDKVSEVANVAADQVEEVRDGEKRSELLQGIARMKNGRLVLLVDARALMQVEVAAGDAISSTGFHTGGSEGRENKVAAEREAEVQLVSFRLGREEFGLDIAAVQEIVRLPESINRVPNAPSHLLGVISLRSRVLPIVSLNVLLRFGEETLDDRARIVVLNLPGRQVGLVVDAVSEVLRIPRSLIDPVPSLLCSEGGGEISGVCKIAGGKRLVYMLDPLKLLSATGLSDLGDEGAGEAVREKSAARGGAEEQLVIFKLGREEFGVGISEVREIIRIPEVVAVPKAPHFIEGVINLRGTIIPVIDLRKRFAMATVARDERARVVVVEMNGVLTGLIVDSVREVLKVPKADIELAPELLSETVDRRFIRGIAKISEGERLVIVLDVAEVLSFREKQELADFGEHITAEGESLAVEE